MKVMVETSARHVHLSQEDLDTLFGKGYRLTNKKDLSQPGQFACEERVSVIGPKENEGCFHFRACPPCFSGRALSD